MLGSVRSEAYARKRPLGSVRSEACKMLPLVAECMGTAMRLHSVNGNCLHLDGGAMHGHVPKTLWARWTACDVSNRIPLASRALLVDTGDHRVLFETGTGAFMEPKYRERYGICESEHVLLESLSHLGLGDEDITDIILSHLHFDHAGGLLGVWQEDKQPKLIFPNANVYVSRQAWDRAQQPHLRDKASFVPEVNRLLERSGRVVILDARESLRFGELEVSFLVSNGHTPGMLCSDLRWDDSRLVFGADLIPGRSWVHLPVCMGYDRSPELVVDEKQQLLLSLAAERAWLFYTHDPEIAASEVEYDGQQHRFRALRCFADLRLNRTDAGTITP